MSTAVIERDGHAIDREDFSTRVVILKGLRPAAVNEAALKRRFGPVFKRFTDEYEWDPAHARAMLESFADPESNEFSFSGLKRSIAQISEAQANTTGMRGFGLKQTREAITTSQTSAAINLIVVNTLYNDYGQTAGIYQDLAEMDTSNGEDMVFPEEFADDMPVPVAETEPAPETRLGTGIFRIRSYVYARALAISKRYFDRDKTGQVRRAAQNFGRNYKKAIDKSFVNSIFREGQLTNLMNRGGRVPSTNIAGQNAYGTYYTPTAGPVNPDRLEAALVAPAQFVDPYGTPIDVTMDTVFVDTMDRMRVKRYLTSQYTSNQPAADPGGQAAGTFSENPLRDEYKIAYSPYVKQTRAPIGGTGFPWLTLQAKRGPVVIMVQDLKTLQEPPNAGRSLDERSYRWTCEAEWGTGVRNARLLYYGN